MRLRGTVGVRVAHSVFEQLDGNALLLDGFNRRASIVRNTFRSLGASAVALWGYEHRGLGTSGEQPRHTVVAQNFCFELGIYQKQSSCFFQAVSAQSNISENIFFNGPRALVNFNDNFVRPFELFSREVVMTLAATFSSIAAESLRVRPSGILLTSLGAAGTS